MFEGYYDFSTFIDTLPSPETYEEHAICNYSELIDDFSLLLAKFRMENGMTQKELASRLTISQAMISQYESGSRNISLSTLCDIVSKLGKKVSLSYKDIDENKTHYDNDENQNMIAEETILDFSVA